MFNIDKVMEFLPHRYPFLLVDRILEADGNRVVGLKNVTINEPFFMGHFPGEPVMPGVLIVEAMGQAGAVVLLSRPDFKGKVIYLTSVEKARFRRPVRPGDQMITTAELTKLRGKVGKVRTVARVGDDVVAEADLGFVVDDRLE
ncbi:MAG: 3-hydroxyacyl-ACP dehydratase FabZ [Synergistales bacterium]|uniref:3-hydroxyacyl-[acyl-carrier-protein] dehydratase FabZ n=1 Tax=Dethiosulfovibrio salsuginis TaxID=561720 RepID=A0A1X7JP95_9BACT|nr:3-hydroxyacyl-ACP dehydratase FabZ [Dethiosulfovibrio salsuginis]NCC97460.1 3-hydroxyacyl-ACP dehydratase FabZ [Synergistales bacterium]SMG29824.1 3-hydroxyacyl-[acyl-carrier-protein] dehydratase [Dethiosulfovibrio salsuginis]